MGSPRVGLLRATYLHLWTLPPKPPKASLSGLVGPRALTTWRFCWCRFSSPAAWDHWDPAPPMMGTLWPAA